MPDDDLLAIATAEELVFVTNNHADFVGLCANADLHAGLIVLPQRPREQQHLPFRTSGSLFAPPPVGVSRGSERERLQLADESS